jgi:hypothetical protein
MDSPAAELGLAWKKHKGPLERRGEDVDPCRSHKNHMVLLENPYPLQMIFPFFLKLHEKRRFPITMFD